MLVWDIDPVLLKLGFLQIRYYGVLFAASFLLGYIMVRNFMIKKGQDGAMADSLLTYMVIGIVLGARLVHVFFYDTGYYLSHPSEILKIWHGGVASHGGVLGAFIAAYIFTIRHKMDFWDIADSVALPMLLAGFFIRVGNFFNSEIVGAITTPEKTPWAVKFVRYDHSLPIEQVPWRHPSQFYEVILSHFIGYAVVILIYRKLEHKMKTGTLTMLAVIWYFFARFIVEFFKEYQTLQSGLTMGQWLSVPFVLLASIFIWYRQKKGNPVFITKK